MAIAVFTKDPDSVLDYTIDWSNWLTAAGSDTISSSSWTVGTGITEDSDSNTTTTATIVVSGGTAGTDYDLANKVVTAGGRTVERTITIKVRQR